MAMEMDELRVRENRENALEKKLTFFPCCAIESIRMLQRISTSLRGLWVHSTSRGKTIGADGADRWLEGVFAQT
jgi:hypothetical protein